MRTIFLPILFLFVSFFNYAQHQDISEKAIMWKGKSNQTDDSTSILHAFKTGVTHGHFRYYFSSTINEGKLTDYYANAIGGGIRFETNQFKKFQFAVSGFYFFNLGSSHLAIIDSITGQANRYEIGLFDIENPDNHKDMDRLEELYLKYNLKNGHLVFGRQLVNTPLINLQDGRMRGTSVEGLWFDYEFKKKLRLEGGWLYAISPRSTTKWYGIQESIGLYPSGVNVFGKKSDYFGNIDSRGVGVISLKYKMNKIVELQTWDYIIENILNTSFSQINFSKQFSETKNLTFAGQFIRQDALNHGGNHDQNQTYVIENSKSMTFGGKVAYKYKKIEYSLNYNRITKHGRYLFPREWGRDPFFTFLPRERSEGFADVHALVGKVEYKNPKNKLKISLGLGYIQMPNVLDFESNKYGLPSYYQTNLDVKWSFDKLLKGLESQLLIVTKLNNGEIYNNSKYEINKVNMLLINYVLNYHF